MDGRDYIIGLRSEAMKKANPRYYPLKPIFSLESEEESINPRMGNFIYTEYVMESGLVKAPETLGYTYNLCKELPVVKQEVIESIVIEEEEDFYAGKKTENKTNKNEKKGLIALNAVLDKDGKDGSGDKNKDAQELKVTVVVTEEIEEEKEEKEEEEKVTVLTEVWIWKCVSMKDDLRPKWRVQYDEGRIKYVYKYLNPKLKNEVVWNFRVWVPLRTLEVMCTDMRCHGMSAVPYLQRAIEMTTYPTDSYVRIMFNVMMSHWYPIKVRTFYCYSFSSTFMMKFVAAAVHALAC